MIVRLFLAFPGNPSFVFETNEETAGAGFVAY